MNKKKLMRRETKKNIYVHNDIGNAAHHLKERIETNFKRDDKEGMSLDIMSCLIMHAFEFEAKINFIGHMRLANWKEKVGFDEKMKLIRQQLRVPQDRTCRPYITIYALKNYRNSLAHGQPLQLTNVESTESTHERIDRELNLDGSLYDLCTIKFLRECEEDIDKIWKSWLDAGKIERFETLTHGSFSVTLISEQ